MTLIEITNRLKHYAEGQFNNPTVKVGSLYENMNTKELKYPCINFDVANTVKRENDVVYSFYIYYVDRLNEDGSNLLEIQSQADTSLQLLLHDIMDNNVMSLDEYYNAIITPFKLKFADVCAGAWLQINIHTTNGINYCGDGTSQGTLYITTNGKYDTEFYNQVNVNVPPRFGGKNSFYFKSREDGSTISFTVPAQIADTIELEYSFDNETWESWDFSAITVNRGVSLYLRGDNPRGFRGCRFATNNAGYFDLGGDIRSLVDKTISITAIPSVYCFSRLFSGCNIVDVDKNLLSGFSTLTDGCFDNMFVSCQSLITAPDLPWTALTTGCYCSMFLNCNSLVNVPVLSAKTLRIDSYSNMFSGCSSLQYLRCLATTNLRVGASGLLNNAAETGIFVKDYTANWSNVENGIPEGWTVKENEIELIDTSVTENGTYTAGLGKGYRSVSIDVPTGITPTGSITINDNGTYDVTEKATAVVNVPTGITPTGTITIMTDGTYDVTNEATAIVKRDDRFKIIAKEANSTVGLDRLSSWQTLEVSEDLDNWSGLTTGTTYTLANSGDCLYVRGILTADNEYNNFTRFKFTGNIKLYGNVNYLWNYNNLEAPLKEHCGYYLFCSSAVTDVSEVILPSMALAPWCYSYMFVANRITEAPELPATGLSSYCYYRMFGSTSLTQIPDLPAMVMATACYGEMFENCTGLTSVPDLLSLTLAPLCYYGMFYGCTNLVKAPELPATTLAKSCYNSMFRFCTSLQKAPVLPAPTLVDRCYYEMFYCYDNWSGNTSNLNYIKCLATDTSATECIYQWVKGVLPYGGSGTFIDAQNFGFQPASDDNDYQGYPYGWDHIKDGYKIVQPLQVWENGNYNSNRGEAWVRVQVNVPQTTMPIEVMTQQQYDALTTKDLNTIYVISS